MLFYAPNQVARNPDVQRAGAAGHYVYVVIAITHDELRFEAGPSTAQFQLR